MTFTVLVVHAAATWALVGLIWTVQLAHYPLFAKVGRDAWPAYHQAHMRTITFVVAPLMLTELLTAGWLALRPPPDTCPPMPIVGIALLAVIWLSTAFVQVPYHRKLERGLDEPVVRALVRSNWIRTVAWTARGGLVLAWVLRVH